MLLGTLGASLLGNIVTGKGVKTTSQGQEINIAGEGVIARRQGRGIVRADYSDNKLDV